MQADGLISLGKKEEDADIYVNFYLAGSRLNTITRVA